MSDIFKLNDKFRSNLLRREAIARKAVAKAYMKAWANINNQVNVLLSAIAEAEKAGETVNRNWLLRADRLNALQREIETQIGQFGDAAEARIILEQQRAVLAATNQSVELIDSALGAKPPSVDFAFNTLPKESFEDLVGFLQNGSPLRNLLDTLGSEASNAITDALLDGIATGRALQRIARDIRDSAGLTLTRSMKIARTEILRSYRESSRRTYAANKDIVAGWIWFSALSPTTCAACFALHGTEHSVDERLNDHVQGKCSMIPRTKSWKELGFEDLEDTRPTIQSGESAFNKLSESDKRAVLGDAGYQAWKDGAVSLQDFIGRRDSPDWGLSFYRRSLVEILGPKASAFKEVA